jgi:hypothetical protein
LLREFPSIDSLLRKFDARCRTSNFKNCCAIAGFGLLAVFSSDAANFRPTRSRSAAIGLALMFVPDAFCKNATELKGFRLSPEFAALLVQPFASLLLTVLNS